MPRLPRSFFSRSTLTVARELLGQRLVRIRDGQRLVGIIVETEAYIGEEDKACHASCGPTTRNAIMYGAAGHAYVYFIYGMYHCLNVVTEHEGFPAAVLIRAVEPCEGIEIMRSLRPGRPLRELASGPGRLCQAMDITRSFNGVDLCTDDGLFIEAGDAFASIETSRRVGIAWDELAQSRPWRFFVAGNPHVSRTRPSR